MRKFQPTCCSVEPVMVRPSPWHEQRRVEDALERRAIRHAVVEAQIVDVAQQEVGERAGAVLDPRRRQALADVVVAGVGRLQEFPGRRGVVVQEGDLGVVARRSRVRARLVACTPARGTCTGDTATNSFGHHDDPVGVRIVRRIARLDDDPDLVVHGHRIGADLVDDLVDPLDLPADRGDLDDVALELASGPLRSSVWNHHSPRSSRTISKSGRK